MPDPVPALVDLAKATPDPRAISNWLTAYLGTRPHDAKITALETLERAFEGRPGDAADLKAAALVLRIIQRLQQDLTAAGGRVAKGRKR